jgi:hypothetical protein
MVFTHILIISYVSATALFMLMTCIEGLSEGNKSGRFYLFGVVLCSAWPVLVIATLVTQLYVRSACWNKEYTGATVTD